MTCTLEQLKAAGLAFEIIKGCVETKYNVAAINRILCDKLVYTDCVPDIDGNRTHFKLMSQPAPIPPPKTVEVTEQMIDDLCEDLLNHLPGADVFSIGIANHIKQKLFNPTQEQEK